MLANTALIVAQHERTLDEIPKRTNLVLAKHAFKQGEHPLNGVLSRKSAKCPINVYFFRQMSRHDMTFQLMFSWQMLQKLSRFFRQGQLDPH